MLLLKIIFLTEQLFINYIYTKLSQKYDKKQNIEKRRYWLKQAINRMHDEL